MHVFQQYLDIITATCPLEQLTAAHFPAPVMVGAVGGSGSRLVVAMLEALGIEMKPYANRGRDSVLWPPFERITDSMAARHNSRDVLVSQAFRALEELWLQYRELEGVNRPMGLKIPASFLWLPELAAYFPSLKYIFVVRDGLDMAFTRNQAQFHSYAWYFGINGRDLHEPHRDQAPPSRLLDYWLAANRYAIETGRHHLGERFHIVDFDRLCREPEQQALALVRFLGASEEASASLASIVEPPESIGRHRDVPWRELFTERQLAQLQELRDAIGSYAEVP